jgi:hypothetical protein
MFEELQQIIAEKEAREKEFQALAIEKLKPAMLKIFRDHPEVKAFAWTQYTPHFNDGEPCVFSVHDIAATALEDNLDEAHYGDGWYEVYGKAENGFSAGAWKALSELNGVLSGAESALHAAFGDGVRVVVTAAGIDVQEYDHD